MGVRLPELLAPAGSLQALAAAVAAGADAVYTGAGAFNARAAATDLSLDELRIAAGLCHGRGARLYVTLNIFVRDDELGEAVALAAHVLEAGADALIVADLGLIAELRRRLGDVEIHLSTQAGVHASAGALLAARELGVSRVTCGRELSVDEIAAMAATGVEIEAFCHGAICVCYAGACSFSSLRRGRSANRGDCTQPCRLHYGLADGVGRRVDAREGDLLLCPRDYLSIRHIPQLVDAGVGALKIEGRMKNPDYVFNVVGCYRAALDAVRDGLPVEVDALEAQLARSFNRGFTTDYLDGSAGAGLMSWERSCNQGLRAGVVVERRYEEVVVELERAVEAGDTLEIRYIPGEEAAPDVPKRWPMVPCPVTAAAGERIAVRCKRKVSCGSVVHVVRSAGVLARTDAAVATMLDGVQDAAPAAPAARAEGMGPSCRSGSAARAGARPCADAGRTPARAVLVETPERAAALLEAGGAEILVPAFAVAEMGCGAWGSLLGRLTVLFDEVSRVGDEAFQRSLCATAGAVACRNLTQVAYARDAGAAFEIASPIPVTNVASLHACADLGARRVWLPSDMAVDRVAGLARAAAGRVLVGVVSSGLPELMVTEHCLLTAEGACSGSCGGCARRRSERFLIERDGTCLPVRVDVRGRTRIYDAEPLDRSGDVAMLAAAGVSCFLEADEGACAW